MYACPPPARPSDAAHRGSRRAGRDDRSSRFYPSRSYLPGPRTFLLSNCASAVHRARVDPDARGEVSIGEGLPPRGRLFTKPFRWIELVARSRPSCVADTHPAIAEGPDLQWLFVTARERSGKPSPCRHANSMCCSADAELAVLFHAPSSASAVQRDTSRYRTVEFHHRLRKNIDSTSRPLSHTRRGRVRDS